MLCAPPMCQPATHFLGCFSLRTGAAVALAADAVYGLCLVILHALLLGEVQEPDSEKARNGHAAGGEERRLGESGQEVEVAHAVSGISSRWMTGGPETAGVQPTNWFIQVVDLDIGFGHQLLGLPDQTNLVCGLLYGIVVTVVSLYVLQAVMNGGNKLPSTARWFMSFAHLQILLYVFISFVKIPKLCNPIQKEYLTHLYMECTVLWFVYLERIAIIITAFSFGTWIFSSFSFVLTFGHTDAAALDKPHFEQALDKPSRGAAGYGGGPGGAFGSAAPQASHAAGGGAMASHAPASRHLVGPAVHSSPYGGGGPGGHPGSHLQPPPSRGGPPPMGGGGNYHGTSYNIGRMPRATSSMATSSTSHSHQENHPLIKPPVAIY